MCATGWRTAMTKRASSYSLARYAIRVILYVVFGDDALRVAAQQQLRQGRRVNSLKFRVAGLPFDHIVLSGIVQVSEKLHPQDFFHGFWTVCVDHHTVGMCSLLFARRAQSDGTEDVVGPKRRKCAVVIAVFERGKARVRRQYVQQQSRASACQSRDVNGRIHRPPRQPPLEHLRLQLAHVNPKIRMRMHQPAEKTHQPRVIKICSHGCIRNNGRIPTQRPSAKELPQWH